jgi:hypothetical protein
MNATAIGVHKVYPSPYLLYNTDKPHSLQYELGKIKVHSLTFQILQGNAKFSVQEYDVTVFAGYGI